MQKTKGFTLIEMLIVIVIIGVLAAALIPKLYVTEAKARDVKRKGDLKTIYTALQIYAMDRGGYPYSTSMMAQSAGYSLGNSVYSWHTGGTTPAMLGMGPSHIFARVGGEAPFWILGLRDYLNSIPVDPLNIVDLTNGYSALYNGPELPKNYIYGYGGRASNSFDLTAKLESAQDRDRCAIQNYRRGLNPTSARCPTGTPNKNLQQLYELSPDSF